MSFGQWALANPVKTGIITVLSVWAVTGTIRAFAPSERAPEPHDHDDDEPAPPATTSPATPPLERPTPQPKAPPPPGAAPVKRPLLAKPLQVMAARRR